MQPMAVKALWNVQFLSVETAVENVTPVMIWNVIHAGILDTRNIYASSIQAFYSKDPLHPLNPLKLSSACIGH